MLLKLVNNALQKYLDSDPEIAKKLDQFEGKRLLMHLTDINKKFLVTPVASGITVSECVEEDNTTASFDTSIQSNTINLLRMAMGSDYQAMLKNNALKVEGDVELANQLRSIFMQVDIDWEEVASKYVGDTVAYQLGLFVNKFKSYKNRSVENFRLDVSEYLQEESRMLPTKVEIDRFMNDVDSLDANLQRLEARVERLLNFSD